MTVVGAARDSTERQRAEQVVAEQSKILESFFKHTQTCLVFLDKDFNFIRVNDAYAKACRRDVSEFPGRNHFEIYPSDARAEFERVVRTKERFEAFANPFTFPDHPEWGVTYWDLTLVPILDGRGDVEFLVFSLNDVTERKRANDALKDAHARLDLVLKAAVAGQTYLSPATSRQVIENYVTRVGGVIPPDPLTPRQRKVLQLVAEGKSTKEIGFVLEISVKTVETHRAQIMERLDIHDVPGLVKYAMRSGLIPPEW